ncbi:hypothetical protein BX666DRAFT_1966540 [Dichotomocladium elegans]|nr:hypothetical protein BX666DRAFT_1966540 [Dichotomocladium elegans]
MVSLSTLSCWMAAWIGILCIQVRGTCTSWTRTLQGRLRQPSGKDDTKWLELTRKQLRQGGRARRERENLLDEHQLHSCSPYGY